jgi:hypothetical protein
MNQALTVFSRLGLVGIVLLATSCSSPPYAARMIGDGGTVANVVINEGSLYDRVCVGSPSVTRIEGTNQMKVIVPILNLDDETIQVLVRVSFLNQQRQPIGDDTNRQVQLIGPGMTVAYTAISKQEDAQDWVMLLGWNR